jgi:hypothetical protein
MSSFLYECQVYVIYVGFLQALAGLLVAPFFFPLANRLGCTSFTQVLRAYLIFNCCLLFWGCLGHYLFHSVTYGKMYVSADRLADWLPFIPFGTWVINQSFGDQRGHLIGEATLWQLRLIWFAIALPVWTLTSATTFCLMRLRIPLLHVFSNENHGVLTKR